MFKKKTIDPEIASQINQINAMLDNLIRLTKEGKFPWEQKGMHNYDATIQPGIHVAVTDSGPIPCLAVNSQMIDSEYYRIKLRILWALLEKIGQELRQKEIEENRARIKTLAEIV